MHPNQLESGLCSTIQVPHFPIPNVQAQVLGRGEYVRKYMQYLPNAHAPLQFPIVSQLELSWLYNSSPQSVAGERPADSTLLVPAFLLLFYFSPSRTILLLLTVWCLIVPPYSLFFLTRVLHPVFCKLFIDKDKRQRRFIPTSWITSLRRAPSRPHYFSRLVRSQVQALDSCSCLHFAILGTSRCLDIQVAYSWSR
jgi:hypothetical protein